MKSRNGNSQCTARSTRRYRRALPLAIIAVALGAPLAGVSWAAAADDPAISATTLSVLASSPIAPGGQTTASVTLSGGSAPTGTITFDLFGPGDSGCTGDPTFSSNSTVTGNGTYTSAPFTAATVGTYEWTAAYGGDEFNSPSSTTCGSDAVVVAKASPSTRSPRCRSTSAGPSPTPGG